MQSIRQIQGILKALPVYVIIVIVKDELSILLAKSKLIVNYANPH